MLPTSDAPERASFTKKMTNQSRHIHLDDTSELLSASLDGALDATEQQRVDQLLATCPACIAEFADLRAVQVALRELPVPLPRRSFTLDPATVQPRMRLFPLFRFASLAAAMLLVLILGVDITGSRSASQSVAVTSSAPESGGTQSFKTQATSVVAAPPAPAEGAQALSATTEEIAPEAPAAATLPGGEAAADAQTETAEVPPVLGAVPAGTEDTANTARQAEGTPGPEIASAPLGGTAGEASGGASASSLAENTPTPEVAALAVEQATSGNAASNTTTLQAPAESVPAPSPPQNAWRLLEYILGAATIILGAVSWWLARRNI